MVNFNVRGVIAPVFTPIHEDGQINLELIPGYARFLISNGIKSILVGGTTGEFVSLSVDEKKSILDAWMKEAKSLKFDVMVHVGGAPLPYVIEMAKYAEQVKVNSILTLPELYFKPKSPEELVSYVEVVASAAPSLPLVYYHNPVMSGVDVNWPEFFRLAKSRIPNFVGMKADLLVANQVASQLSDGRKVFICNHVSFDIQGVIAPVFTPIHEDGQINVDPIPDYAKFLAKNGIRTVLVGGTTGEFVSLSVDEKKTVLDAWMKEAKSLNLKVIVHVGGAPLPYVIEMAKYAEKVKVDAIMTLPELYFKPRTPEQLVAYLEIVAKAAPSLPLLYYNFPMMSGVDVHNANFFRLAILRIPTFMGMKADLKQANQVAKLLTNGRKVFIANHEVAPSVLMGHDSSIATVSNMFPKLVLDIVETTQAGDVDRAKALQTELNDLVDVIASEGEFVPSMKVAMECVTGIKVGPPRLPQAPLDNNRRGRIQEKLREMGHSADL